MGRYVIITPARNEATFIKATIEGVVNHNVLPERWIIVSDGSQNAVDNIIDWKGSQSGGVNKNHIVFDGFVVRNCRRRSFWIEGDSHVIRNCTISDRGD